MKNDLIIIYTDHGEDNPDFKKIVNKINGSYNIITRKKGLDILKKVSEPSKHKILL